MKSKNRISLKSLISLIFLLWVNSTVQAGQFVVDLSYQLESGEYATDMETDVTIIPVQLKYYAKVWSFAAEVSYVSVTGSETLTPGSNGQNFGQSTGSVGMGADETKSVTRSGMGDTRLSISRAFFPEHKNGWFHELTASAKIATADEQKFLGKGENDYSIKLKTSSKIGLWKPGLTVGYQLTGDTPDTDFNNTLFFSVGSGYQLSKNSSLGIGYDFQQAVIDDVDDFAALTLNYSTQLNNGAELNFAVKTGLTDNSLDRGFKISTSIPF